MPNWVVQRGRYLEAVVYGPGILRKAALDIEANARKHIPIDPDATADRAMVAASVRDGGSGGRIPPSPPTRWGQLSAHEGRQKVKDEFGFDPGWGH